MTDKAATPPTIAPALSEFRQSKDEMNLVEHPFALLKRGKKDEVIHLEWEKIHPISGKVIQAEWRVSGDPELGLPGPVEERLYLVLMEITKEQSWPQTVHFSRNDILKRLGLSRTKGNYATLHDAFGRLARVGIDAKRSFWDATAQNFAASLRFNLIDEVRTIDEPGGTRAGQIPLMLSSFKWSDVVYQSFLAGNVRSLDISFALSLESNLGMRLYRYLDKHHQSGKTTRHKYEIELHRLCGIHLGMAATKFASKLKERLAPAHEELIARKFLAEVRYEPMKTQKGKEKVVYYFADGEPEPKPLPATPMPSVLNLIVSMDMSDEEKLNEACDAVFNALPDREDLTARFAKEMPAIMRPSMDGYKLGIARQSREHVKRHYMEAVRDYLAAKAQNEPDSVPQ